MTNQFQVPADISFDYMTVSRGLLLIIDWQRRHSIVSTVENCMNFAAL